MDGICNAVVPTGSFSVVKNNGFNNRALLRRNADHREECHPVKVRLIDGWADGVKGWFVDGSLYFERCISGTDVMRVKLRLVG